jgi:serine/threonine protein phosphatase PrpC
VVEAGGRVAAHRVCHPFLSPQVISIAVSRSIGDSLFKLPEFCRGAPPALTAEPWVMARQLRLAEDWFVLLACDGVFDVMTLEVRRRLSSRCFLLVFS